MGSTATETWDGEDSGKALERDDDDAGGHETERAEIQLLSSSL